MSDTPTPRVHQAKRRGLFRGNDLRTRTFPDLTEFDGRRPSECVELLRVWAEGMSQDTIEWYLTDKKAKRIGSRLLRAATIALLVGGALVPLISATLTGEIGAWGYVLLAAAAGCGAFDYFFGLSSGWMRAMTTAQSLQRRLNTFRLDWATRAMQEGELVAFDDAASAARVAHRIDLIRQFVSEVDDLVDTETREWLVEFRANVQDLQGQAKWGFSQRLPRDIEVQPDR